MMPAYNFQPQFVKMILKGFKPHTIRRLRKHPTKVGDVLMMFVGLRTKHCFRFAEAPCTRIEPIVIEPFKKRIISPIDFSIEKLAEQDGFVSVDSFFEFFQMTYKREPLIDFEILFWDPKQLKDLTVNLYIPINGPILGKSQNLWIVDDIGCEA